MNVGKSKSVERMLRESGSLNFHLNQSETPYRRGPTNLGLLVEKPKTMGLGDVAGTLVDPTLEEEVIQAALYMEQQIGPRRAVQQVYNRLKAIQAFNENWTGMPKPLEVFFPDAMAQTLFLIHKMGNPRGIKAVPPEHRQFFLGLVRFYLTKDVTDHV